MGRFSNCAKVTREEASPEASRQSLTTKSMLDASGKMDLATPFSRRYARCDVRRAGVDDDSSPLNPLLGELLAAARSKQGAGSLLQRHLSNARLRGVAIQPVAEAGLVRAAVQRNDQRRAVLRF